MANHEAFSLTPFPVDILFARYDVIQEWNLDASELVMPYWRLYRPENSFGYIRIKEQEIQLQKLKKLPPEHVHIAHKAAFSDRAAFQIRPVPARLIPSSHCASSFRTGQHRLRSVCASNT